MFTLLWTSALFSICQMEAYFCTYKLFHVFLSEAFTEYFQLHE